jgi:hypothetical protein
MENPALENSQPAGGELEALARDDDRMPAVPSGKAAALRVPDVRDV